MKKCLFTINFGNYDRLRDPIKTDGWDYIVFTNNDITSDVWDVRRVDFDMSNHYAARYVYINSHKFLPEYDYSIMVGGQIEVKGNLDKFVEQNFDLTKDFNLMKHPCRTCVYDEAALILKEGWGKYEEIDPQMARYKKEGFPEKFGLSACGIIGRRRNIKIKEYENRWWNEVINGACRDQLSFDYVRWRYPDCTHHWFPTPYWDLLHGEFFDIYRHGTDKFA